MRMKNKIIRAFTKDQPDLLPQIQNGCPDKAAPRRKHPHRLSDRAVRIISTAASAALLIGAVFGGFVYFRNAYPNGILHYGPSAGGVPTDTEPSRWGPTSPDEQWPTDPNIGIDWDDPPYTEIVPVAPLPTVDYDTSVKGLITRTDDIIYPLELRDAPYEVPDIPVEWVVEDGWQKQRIVRNDNGYCIRFDFDAESGILLSIQVLDCECEKEGLLSPYVASWIAFMDAAPEHFQSTQNCFYHFDKSEEDVYRIYTEIPGDWTYYVDAHTGKILSREFMEAPVYIPLIEARDKVLLGFDIALEDVWSLKIYENGDSYEVLVLWDDQVMSVWVDAVTGEVLYSKGPVTGVYPPCEQLEGVMGWRKAQDIALKECGYQLQDLLGFTWDFFDDANGQVYWMDLYFADDSFSFRIDAVTGEVLEDVVPDPGPGPTPPDGDIGEYVAIKYAVAYAGLEPDYAAGTLTDIFVKYDDTDVRPCYWVYFTFGKTNYEICVDAYNEEIIGCNVYGGSTGFYTEEDIINAARNYTATPNTMVLSASIELAAPGGSSFYLVVFRSSAGTGLTYVMVDSDTLRCMDHGADFEGVAVTRSAAFGIALDYLGMDDWESGSLALSGYFNSGEPFYCMVLHEQTHSNILVINAHSGQIIDYTTAKLTANS